MRRRAGGLRTDDGVRAAYRAHGAELYRFAHRSLGDPELAEEAVQETFLRAWRAGDRFQESLGSLRTWLFAIARNVVIDLDRARSVRPRLAEGDGHDQQGASSEALDAVLEAWQVDEALTRLSHDHRIALVEVHGNDRPYEEVAEELGVPVGTVKSRVYYALRSLRLALDEVGWSDDGA